MEKNTNYDFSTGSSLYEEYASTPEVGASMAAVHEFHIADYVVLVLMLVVSLGIGFFFACFGGKQKTTDEYLRGSKKMSMLPVVLSLMASYISASGTLGTPAEVYYNGFEYLYLLLGSILGIPISAYLFLPVFYDMNITSIFEYLQRRFGRSVRICGSISMVITLMIFASFNAYGPALALSQVTGLHLWGSIIGTTVIGTVYTSMGGIKAVMWTDAMQMVIIAVSLLVAIIKGSIDVGGFNAIIETAKDGQRLGYLSFSFDPRVRYTFWGFTIAATLAWISGYGTSQMQVQRYAACPTRRKAQWSLWLNVPGMCIVWSIYCFIGLVLYTKYAKCDPMISQQIQLPDQILPLFVMETMGDWPGLPGLFVAGVYSASLSTTSSVLNSLAAVTLEDYIRPHYKDISEEKATLITKCAAIVYGALTLLLVLGITHAGNIVEASWYLVGGSNGGNFGLFTLGLFIPWATSRGAIIGLVCGLIVSWWFSLGNQIYKPMSSSLAVSTAYCDEVLGYWEPLPSYEVVESKHMLEVYKVAYVWIMPIAWFLTVFVGSLASLCIGRTDKPVDPTHLSPIVRYFVEKRSSKEVKHKPVPTEEEDPPPTYSEVTEPLKGTELWRKNSQVVTEEEPEYLLNTTTV